MGKIVIHAGQGKSGSSSIQAWLGDHSERLRERSGITGIQGAVEPSGEIRMFVHTSGPMISNPVARRMSENPRERQRINETVLAGLDEHARRHEVIVFSSEGFSAWFFKKDEHFLSGLDELAADHEVEVAYYIRPQHSALDAAWRQWGFRFEEPPRTFLERRSRQMEHLQTYTFVREVAPRVGFAPRPFRRDLMHGGNVVSDFAYVFLGLPTEESMQVWENTGLPLDMVNALQSAPVGQIWRSGRDNKSVERLKSFVADLDVPESDRARLSRLVLQQACHERFEPDNQVLISELGWQTDAWVPPVDVDVDVGEATFERMNELWRPHASDAEQVLLQHTVAELLRRGLESADV